jgi:protein phosphatase
LEPGTILIDRYEVIELLEAGPERRVYRARDLSQCIYCGYEQNPPDSDFCEACGAVLDRERHARVVEMPAAAPESYDLHFISGQQEYFVSAEADEEIPGPAARRERQRLTLTWGQATDPGLQRDHNEDYLDTWFYTSGSGPLLSLFVVADGLGGQDSGEVASRLATETVWQTLREHVWEPIMSGQERSKDELDSALVEAVETANQTVYDRRIEQGSEMSTTLTLALVVDGTAHIGNVGDSRTYLWSAEGLQQITRDHSLVQRLVDAGELRRDEVYTHPQRNLIYQSIGDRAGKGVGAKVQVDTYRHQLRSDDRLILCSDGLWEMVRDEGLEEVLLSEPDPQRACDRLIENANLAGGEDNISVIIVQAVGSAKSDLSDGQTT